MDGEDGEKCVTDNMPHFSVLSRTVKKAIGNNKSK
jgi:hypothetical protein